MADINPAVGIVYHAIGGLAAGSFYLPLKGVKKWSWEAYWLAQGVASWIIAPLIGAFLTIPDLWGVLSRSPGSSIGLAFLFGVLWGVGGLTFGLSMRYLGMSLGYSIALGFCAAGGTLIPPIATGNGGMFFNVPSQMVILGGLIVCLLGIAVCGYAGSLKEKDLSAEQIKAAIKEFALTKGIIVAVFAGVMSACMAFALNAAAPIAKEAVTSGADKLYSNNAAMVVVLLGGFTTNFIWCMYLLIKNKTIKDYATINPLNYLLCFVGGTTWYLQFFFYGMGQTKMSDFSYASWTIHMAFIIAFSNLWGILLGEWKGSKSKTRLAIIAGLVVLIGSTLIVGWGNKMEMVEKEKAKKEAAVAALAQ